MSAEQKCPYCGTSFASTAYKKVVSCSECHGLMHEDCWNTHRGCSYPHCRNNPEVSNARVTGYHEKKSPNIGVRNAEINRTKRLWVLVAIVLSVAILTIISITIMPSGIIVPTQVSPFISEPPLSPLTGTFSPTTPASDSIRPTLIPSPAISSPIARESSVTILAQPANTSSSQSACSGAAASRFQPGDIVVVDFQGDGALRILRNIDGGAMDTLAQAYDNQSLTLLDGPVCGSWRGRNVWYWYVQHQQTGVEGWVAEGTASDLWMCPLANPECSN